MRVVLFALAIGATGARAEDGPNWLQSQLAAAEWREAAPGIERLAIPAALEGEFAAYRLAMAKITARVLAPLRPGGSTVADLAKASGSILAVNGGFFWIKPDGALAPTGLLIVDGVKLAAMKACRACTGVLFADAEGLDIVRPARFRAKRGIESALQVGPMLIEQGREMTFKSDGPAAPRTAVCIAGDTVIVVVAVRPMTLHGLAALLAAKHSDGGFDCPQAINLDGGSSSQLAADIGGASDRLGYPVRVQNALAFFPR